MEITGAFRRQLCQLCGWAMLLAMLGSTIRRALLPPIYSERLTPAQWAVGLKTHGALCLLAAFFDLAIIALLSRSAEVDHEVARRFALINIPILVASALASFVIARSPRLQRLDLMSLLIAATTGTSMVWIQATGSLTSYFLIMGAVVIACYRMYFGFTMGAIAAALMSTFHVASVGLEYLGVLDVEPLFLGPTSSIYAIAEYRAIVLSSLLLIYFLTFVATNSVMNRLRATDQALAAARQQVAELGALGNRGRLTGTLLDGDYALGERLGAGGFGEVYTARQVSSEREVAVKVLHAHLGREPDFAERFRREAELANRIPAQYTAPIAAYGIDSKEEVHYFVMELLRGEDLAAYMKRLGPLPLDDLQRLAAEIAEALDAAHRAEVIHRDLKPQNIFLSSHADGSRNLRLLDFGMSKALNSKEHTLTRSNAMIGTIGYMAPEQALGRLAEIGPASDIFAFAAILYRAATGQPAFQKADVLASIHDIVNRDPPRPSTLRADLPAQIDAVLSIGLAKRARDRYQTGGALVRDLQSAMQGELAPDVIERAQALVGSIDVTETAAMASN